MSAKDCGDRFDDHQCRRPRGHEGNVHMDAREEAGEVVTMLWNRYEHRTLTQALAAIRRVKSRPGSPNRTLL